jgi:hypothetical protein
MVTSAKGKQTVYSATAHCRGSYLEALREELGEDRALEVLRREGIHLVGKNETGETE